MALFPVRLFPVSFDGWKSLFAASHTCKMWHGRPVGKAYVWATFHGSRMDTLRA
jgi:hypothetical protein